MKLWRWDHGRQGSGYSKLTLLFSNLLKCDAYILKIPKGVAIPRHSDPVPSGRHYRVNITILGHLRMETDTEECRTREESYVKRIGDWFSYFRPDIIPHWAEAVERDTYIFSFGWLRS